MAELIITLTQQRQVLVHTGEWGLGAMSAQISKVSTQSAPHLRLSDWPAFLLTSLHRIMMTRYESTKRNS